MFRIIKTAIVDGSEHTSQVSGVLPNIRAVRAMLFVLLMAAPDGVSYDWIRLI